MKSALHSAKTLTLILIAASGLTAKAGVLIEPYLGYHTGTESGGLNTVDGKASGVTYGGRLGYQQLGFMGGLDYMTGSWKDDSKPAFALVPSDLGIFAGFNFPIMLRVYAVYDFQAKIKASRNGSSSTLDGGDGIKLGVGFTALPLLSINLEYMTATYKNINGAAMTKSEEAKMYGITVSLPFDI